MRKTPLEGKLASSTPVSRQQRSAAFRVEEPWESLATSSPYPATGEGEERTPHLSAGKMVAAIVQPDVFPALTVGAEPAGKAAPEWDALLSTRLRLDRRGRRLLDSARRGHHALALQRHLRRQGQGRQAPRRAHDQQLDRLQRGTNPPEFFYGTTADGKPASFIKPQQGSKRRLLLAGHGTRTAQGLYFFLHRVVTVQHRHAVRIQAGGWLARPCRKPGRPSAAMAHHADESALYEDLGERRA